MIRLDLSSAAVVGMAVASALSAAFWAERWEGFSAAPAPVVAAPAVASSDPAQVVREPDGHYWAEADIDGKAVRLLVDTGATQVALTREDAARLGLKLRPADFTAEVVTASGPARAAAVELDSVAVAGARVDKVAALVVEEGLSHSLLGMSYLGRLSRLEATPAGLTLRP
jgi:aspartyl protease family protein